MASDDNIVISVSVPKVFLEKLDEAAKASYSNRSEYIRQAVVEKFSKPPKQLSDWVLVEALPDEISDEELIKIVKLVKSTARNLRPLREY